MTTTQQFFAPCPRGLEAVLADELTALGATAIKPADGGVGFAGDFALCYRANLHSRIASRILWRLAEQPYRSEEDIYHAAYALPWQEWFDIKQTFRVKVSAIRCPLRSLDFVTLRIKDAVCDKFRVHYGERPSIDTAAPDMRIYAFLTADMATLYLDTSGEALFKRGYRKEQGEAPLRENLAAGILTLAGWEPGKPLLDPMCGSGTFLIEAAQMVLNIAPGAERWFAFEQMKNFDADAWDRIYKEAEAAELPKVALPIFGSDVSSTALIAARANLEAAGLTEVVSLKQINMLDISSPAPEGILVTNPPYAIRIGEQEEMAPLYPKLGDLLKQKFGGWRACFLSADMRLAKLIRLSVTRRIPLYNGALDCRLFVYDMVAGSNRKKEAKPDGAGPDSVTQ
ncbi:MAG: THUMP domain-containing protein [Betaproteobacteria bacterium]|nr:THUMP domain-containing protein [Betaproteobacteria bacterium]